MSTYNNYGYDCALAKQAIDELAAAVRLAIDAFARFALAMPRPRRASYPPLITIGKVHRGYAKSRLRIHQRRG